MNLLKLLFFGFARMIFNSCMMTVMEIPKEQLMEYLGSEAGKTVISEIGFISLDDHKSKLDEGIKGLATSKATILTEKKALDEKFKSVLPKVEAFENFLKIAESNGIVLDKDGIYDFNPLEDLIIKGKTGAGGNNTDLEKTLAETRRERRDLEIESKKYKSIAEQQDLSIKAANQFIEKLLVEDEFRKELTALGDVPKELIDTYIFALKQQCGATVEVDAENPNNRRAVTKEGDSIARFIELWSVSPAGKAARRAPQNSGGGAGHSGGSGSYGNKKWTDMTIDERDDLYLKDREEYSRRKNAHLSGK